MAKKGLTKMQLKSRLLSGAVYILVCILMIHSGFQGTHHTAGFLALGYLIIDLAWIAYSIWLYRRNPVKDSVVDEKVSEDLRKRALALGIVGGGTLIFLLVRLFV